MTVKAIQTTVSLAKARAIARARVKARATARAIARATARVKAIAIVQPCDHLLKNTPKHEHEKLLGIS